MLLIFVVDAEFDAKSLFRKKFREVVGSWTAG